MKILTVLMLMLTAAVGLFTVINPNLYTGIALGVCAGIFVVAGMFKAFGNH